jgi:hypothetical protein
MPQATTTAPQAARAQAPSAGAAPAARAGSPTPIAAPSTQRDVDVLLSRRSELSTQLNSASGRRNELARQLRSAMAGPDRSGIEARITQLDGRIQSIESDMEDVGHALAVAPPGLRQTTSTGVPAGRYGPFSSGQLTGITVVGTVFVVGPMVWALAMLALRRAARPAAPQIPKEVAERLERMEQGIDAVAVEVERIGEGQRFVTQLMAERAQRGALREGAPGT